MTPMTDHLVAGGGKLVENAVNKPVRTILMALKANFPRAGCWRDHAAILVFFCFIQQFLYSLVGFFVVIGKYVAVPFLATVHGDEQLVLTQ
ncbi:hypothetical protein [Leisingera sp. ANG-M1]|uniref:hypothetical protein n=1 Tax=Leisingera sp. ANG-M1 TaxID=1577895 RepID=UPI001269E411|nr:hypothetical protein [Leisingera sp. ANG-M1]